MGSPSQSLTKKQRQLRKKKRDKYQFNYDLDCIKTISEPDIENYRNNRSFNQKPKQVKRLQSATATNRVKKKPQLINNYLSFAQSDLNKKQNPRISFVEFDVPNLKLS